MRQPDVGSHIDDIHQQSGESRFRPDIEGLRAVAVLAVVLFHAAVPGIHGGYVGVDVFFVISGFLITGLLWRETKTTGSIGLRRFYGARARRLLPASAAVGIVTLLLSIYLLPPLQVRGVIDDGIASALYVSNFWFGLRGLNYFGDHPFQSPFQHYWSLGVEEQFYLIWPPLILGTAWLVRHVHRRTRSEATAAQRPFLIVLTLMALISFALSFVVTYAMQPLAFFSLPTRAWQLATGGLVALTATRWQQLTPRVAAIIGWTGLAVIMLACAKLDPTTSYPGVAALLPTLGATLVIVAGCAIPTQGCGRALALSPMRALGRISYSWYLWHWPILIFAPFALGHPLDLTARLIAATFSGVLAVLTLRFVENPLRYASPIRRSAIASLTLGGAVTALSVSVAVALIKVVPVPVGPGPVAKPLAITRTFAVTGSATADYDSEIRNTFAQVQAALVASAYLGAVPSNLDPPLADAKAEEKSIYSRGCLRQFTEGGQRGCAIGDQTSAKTMVIIGDSHAAMWTPAFEEIAAERHWRAEMTAKAGCPLVGLPVSNLFSRLAEHFQHCNEWHNQVVSRIRAEHPQLVVISMWRNYGAGVRNGLLTGFTPYDRVWIDGLSSLVRQLSDNGIKTLVLGPVPDPQSVVPICLSDHLDDASACTPPRSIAVNPSGIAAEAAATKAAGGIYSDLSDLFCTMQRCPVIVGHSLVYFDENHVTREYSRLLAPAIGAILDHAVIEG